MGVRVIVEKNNLDRCATVLLQKQATMSTEVVKAMQTVARRQVPVDTGALFRGIEYHWGNPAELTAGSMDGGASREYAAYNEYGTRYMSAQPFMMPAFVAVLPRVDSLGRRHIGIPVEAAA